MKLAACASLALAALVSAAGLARADDAATVKQRLKAASADVHSVVIEFEMSPPTGIATPNMPRSINMLLTVESPQRVKVVAIAGPMHVETYQVDGMLYMHMQPGDVWRKMAYDPARPPAQILAMISAAKDGKLSILPDRDDAGGAVGVVQLEMALPAVPGTASVGPPIAMTCEYDKLTYRVRSCANQRMSMSFTKYNDPSNTVELPAGAAGAVLLVRKTPAPAVTVPSPRPNPNASASPDPSPSPSASGAPVPAPAPSQSPQLPSETPSPAASAPSHVRRH